MAGPKQYLLQKGKQAVEAIAGIGHNQPPKAPTKKALQEAEDERRRLARARTVEERGFKPGKNVQPFINPDERDVLAKIRLEHGPSTIERKYDEKGKAIDMFEGSDETAPYIDAAQTAHLFPPPTARTRPQRPLQRIDVPPSGTSPRMQQMLEDPNVKASIRSAAEQGKDVQSWYDTTPLQQLFVKEFGQEEGMKRFEDYIGMVAGTSTGSKIGQNIKVASNYYAQKYGGGRDAAELPYARAMEIQSSLIKEFGNKEGNRRFKQFMTRVEKNKPKPDDPSFEVPPKGYGAHMQQTHMHNVNNLAREGELSSMDNPKIAAFYENLLGNWMPTTVDKHAVRLAAMATKDPRWLTEQGTKSFNEMSGAGLDQTAMMNKLLETPTNWLDVPGRTGSEYAAMEKMWNEVAQEMGVSPAELQAMAWVGGGRQTGLGSAPVTFMDAFQDRIRRTSIRDNIPPDQVLKLMLHGKMTLAELEPGAEPETGGGSMIG
jgi:hypothetical protein